MSPATGLDVFDATLHKTNDWLKDLMTKLPARDKHEAYAAMRAVLHALRDRITVVEVAQLGAQLTMLIRGFYYEGWDPAATAVKERRRDQFLAHITRELRIAVSDRVDPEQVARAVFTVLAQRVSDGEIADVKQVLPRDVRELWP